VVTRKVEDGQKTFFPRIVRGPLGCHLLSSLVPKSRFRGSGEKNQNKVIWGLQRSLINNALIGISKGYEINLNLNGVGFRANMKGNQIQFQLGFSHDILFDIPEGITVKIDKQTKITLNGIDKQLIGKVAADIKFLKPVEPYKQKGITSDGQFVLKKEGKKK